jgi:hypothetical protein
MEEMNHFTEFSEENELDEKQYREELTELIEAEAQSNYERDENPMLSVEQLEVIISMAATACVLHSLMDKGLIEAKFDIEEGDVVYSLSEQAKDKSILN